MTDLNPTQLKILKAVVDVQAAIQPIDITEHDIAEALQLDPQEVLANIRHLEKIGAVTLKKVGSQGVEAWWVKITPEGRMALRGNEDFLENKAKSGSNTANVYGSGNQIQLGTNRSTQNLMMTKGEEDILSVLSEIKKHSGELCLDPQAESDLVGDIETVEALSKLPNSRPAVLRSALDLIKGILEKISIGTVVKLVADKVPSWIERISNFLQHPPL